MIRVETFVGRDAVKLASDFDRLSAECLSGWPFFVKKTKGKGSRDFFLSISDTLHAVVIRDGDLIVGGTYGHVAGWNVGVSSHQLAKIIDPLKVYWIALTAILPEYQGQGISHKIYNARDPWIAKSRNYEAIAHVLVKHPDDHPHRPKSHAPLEKMWNSRGYYHIKELDYEAATIDAFDEPGKPTNKTMQIWMKDLRK